MSEDDATKIARLEERVESHHNEATKSEDNLKARIVQLEGNWRKGAWAVVALVGKGIYDFIKDGG